jgi:hypothetical protein
MLDCTVCHNRVWIPGANSLTGDTITLHGPYTERTV